MQDQPGTWGQVPPGQAPGAAPAVPLTAAPLPTYRPAPPRSTTWTVVKVLLIVVGALGLLVSVGLNVILLAAAFGGESMAGRITEEVLPDHGTPGARARIAVIEIDGIIEPGNVERWTRLVDRARRDERVRAVVLAVNSPGGGMTAADEFHRTLTKLGDAGKPIVVSMGSVAASGAYYVSMPAAEILAEPTTVTGSIGVMMPHISIAGFIERHGVKDETFVAQGSHNKYAISWTREVSPEGRKMIQGILDDAYERFVKVIVEGRQNLNEAQIRSLADGSLYTANQAKTEGLVDDIGYRDQAIERARALSRLTRFTAVRYVYVEPFSLRSLLGIEARPRALPIDPSRWMPPEGPQVMLLWPGWMETPAVREPR